MSKRETLGDKRCIINFGPVLPLRRAGQPNPTIEQITLPSVKPGEHNFQQGGWGVITYSIIQDVHALNIVIIKGVVHPNIFHNLLALMPFHMNMTLSSVKH